MKNEWYIYSRGPIPLYRIDFFDTLRESILKHNKKFFCDVLFTYEKDITYWAWGKKGVKEWSEELLHKLEDRKLREKLYADYENFSSRAILAAEKIRKYDLTKKSNTELVKLVEYLEKESAPACGFTNVDLDVFDICFVDYLQAKIKNELKQNRIKITEQEMLDLFRELSDPVYTTFIAKEEKMIAQAALKKQMVESSAKKLEGKYWWIGIGWEGIVVRGDAYYKKEIQKYSKKKNLSSMIKEIDERPKEIKKKRDGILAKYKLSKGIGELLDVFDRFTYFHDLRKEMQMRTVYSFDLLLSEVVKRFKIRLSDKELYSRKEIKGILAGKKVDSIDLNGRKKTILVLVTKKGIKTLVGDEAIRFRRKELDQDSEDVTELKGIGVTKGKIRARVKVCNGINDARDKMKKGDILVTGMTLPDYVPVMKIASAIITNEGGITCHAAIVSRELGIPCIVGTKIATQVLQDGDLVEVDADKGIVKIIEKKYN